MIFAIFVCKYLILNFVDSFFQASATAQAALAGKQILLQGLEQQYRDAQTGLMGEKQQLMQVRTKQSF